MAYKRADLLKDIARSSVYGNLGLFVGAGMSKAVLNDEFIDIALSWGQLIEKCIAELNIDISSYDFSTLSYPDRASLSVKLIQKQKGGTYEEALQVFKEKVSELTCWHPSKDQRQKYFNVLEKIYPEWIITTNYDLVLESILTGRSLTLGPEDTMTSPRELIPIFHLHGVRTNPKSLVITQEDYVRLFRPNEYRQQKLPLLLKESTTIFIGYGLGDFNVLTALDWVRNVYPDLNENKTYPNKVIQLLKSSKPQTQPYEMHNGVFVLEFNNLEEILIEISQWVEDELVIQKDKDKELAEYNQYFTNGEEGFVHSFLNERDFRESVLNLVKTEKHKIINGFLSLFQMVVEKSWERTRPNGAFDAYGDHLNLILDIICAFEIEQMPPALFDAVVYQLNKVAYYVGNNIGQSRPALRLWQRRRNEVNAKMKNEIMRLIKSNHYYNIRRLNWS